MRIEWTAAWAAAVGVIVFFLAWLAIIRTERKDLELREKVALLGERVRLAEKYIDKRFLHAYYMDVVRLKADYKL